MIQVLWDASGLAKRYAPERGSQTVDALFVEVSLSQMSATFVGYAEAASLLLRKRNRGEISAGLFNSALSLLQAETVSSSQFRLLTVDDSDFLDGVKYVLRYNLNASDAAILVAYLRYARSQPQGVVYLFVASDGRFLKAAEAEGLKTLNPETVAAADVPAFLARL